MYEILVDTLRKLGRVDDALDAAVTGYFVDDQRSSWTYGAWARIMTRVVTDENSQCANIK